MGFIQFQIYRIIYPCVRLILILLYPFLKPKIRQIIDLKSPRPLTPLGARSFWVHAASGEIEYAKSLIRELKSTWPSKPIVLTYFSTSAEKLHRDVEVDLITPLPWDQPAAVKEFLTRINPEMLFLARTDFWPELLYQTHQRKIPIVLFSWAVQKKLGYMSAAWYRWLLNLCTHIFVVSHREVVFLKELDVKPPVDEIGDTRWSQVFHRLNTAHRLPPHLVQSLMALQKRPHLILGSTWPEDEKIFLNYLPELIQEGWFITIAPHEISPMKENFYRNFLDSRSIKFWQLSDFMNEGFAIQEDFNVLVVDRVGFLAELYKFSNVAFIGGSYKAKVHSVMEPLATGNLVIVGPHYENNPEAIANSSVNLKKVGPDTSLQQPDVHLVSVLYTQKDWEAFFHRLRRTQFIEARKHFKNQIHTYFQQDQKSVEAIIGKTVELMEPASQV